jgi:surface antigen
MKRHIAAATILSLAGSLGGCADNEEHSSLGGQLFFTGVGAVAGGLLGVVVGSGSGRIVSIAVGAALGGAGGFFAAPYLTSLADREAAAKAAEEALARSKDGEIVVWVNEASGNGGTFRPLSTRSSRMGREICRDLQVTVEANGEAAVGTGVACRAAEGGPWKFRNA